MAGLVEFASVPMVEMASNWSAAVHPGFIDLTRL